MAVWSLLLLQVFLGAGVNAANLCFFPGGVQARDVPCDPSAEVSMCCGSVAACLSNGLCKDESTTNNTGVSYARGTCTDPTWQSPICPQNCQLNQDTPRNSSVFDFRFNGVQVWECNAQGFGTPADYCCESASEKTRCCATQSALFTLLAATQGNALAVQTFKPKTTATSMSSKPAAATPSTPSSPPASPAPASTKAPKTTAKSPIAPSPVQATPTRSSSNSSSSTTPLAESIAAATTATMPAAASGAAGSGTDNSGNRGTNNNNGISTGGVVAIGVGASISSALLVGSAVVFILKRTKTKNDGIFGSPDTSSDGFSGSSFYGGSPIITKAEMVQRERGLYPDSPGSFDQRPRGAMRPGMDRLRIPQELLSINDGNPYTSPSVSELESRLSPKSLRNGRRPSTKVYELA